jgi:predicted amidohydrolase YtcJ
VLKEFELAMIQSLFFDFFNEEKNIKRSPISSVLSLKIAKDFLMKLFYNATFHSMNDAKDSWKAILVENGKIVETFHNIPNFLPNWEIIDLKENFVLPGFIDAHTHSFEGGLYSLGCDLKPCKTISEVLEKIASSNPVGNHFFAYQFDENLIAEKRFPTIEELDQLYPNTPLLLRRIDGHSCVVNSAALKQIPWKKKFSSDFDGILRKEENDIAAHWFHKSITEEGIIQAYKAAEQIALSNGHTCIHTMIGDAQQNPLHYEFFQTIKNDFAIDWVVYPQILNVDTAKKLGAKRVGGCILADGSIGSFTAGLFEPYKQKKTTGMLYQTDEFWNDFVWNAHKNDMQVAVHAIGDKAVDQIVQAYVLAQKRQPKDLRHQVIHGELIQDKTLAQMANYNITAAMQPMFDKLWGGVGNFYDRVLGTERMHTMNRFKTMREMGIKIGGSSDWYITDVDAKQGIDALENHNNSNEQLSRFKAIQLYSTTASFLNHEENCRGTLEQGKKADFIIVENNPFTIKSFLELRLKEVFKDGKKVYAV